MKRSEVAILQEKAHEMLQKAGIIITPEEKENIEIADCGFDDIENCGLQIVVYENNVGKQETFRCRWGEVYIYVEGEPAPDPKAQIPEKYREHLTVWKEIVLRPGDQYTLPVDTKHWFQAGNDGCVVSEFSSANIDEEDVFTDPRVRRIPEIEQD